MKLQALKDLLKSKGIVLNAEVVGDDVEFHVEETTPAGSPDVPGLSADEVKALKALVSNEQAVTVFAKLPTVLEFAQNAEARVKAERDQLIAEIKQNSATPFSDEELGKMDLPMLQKLNAMTGVNYAGIGGGTSLVVNDSDILRAPAVLTNWQRQEA